MLTHRRFGVYGVSVLSAADEAALDDIAATTLVRESALTLMQAGTIRSAGLELRPTFRRPHYTIVLLDLDADLPQLVACENVVQPNPHYLPPEARP